MNYINYISILYFLIYIQQNYSIIVLPFQIAELQEDDAKFGYSIKDFFSDFSELDFYSSIFMEEKDIRILARISANNSLFFLSEEECKRKSVDNAQNYGIITKNSYKLGKSLSYKNISEFNNSLTNYKNGGIISEIFSFYNTTKLKCHPLSYDQYLDKDEIDSQIKINEFKIVIEEFTQNSLCALIGLGKPNLNSKEEINFINELKRSKIIDNYYFTYKFITPSSGEIIIGSLPHEYYNNSKFYKDYQLVKINSKSWNDYSLPWSFIFNKIYIDEKNNSFLNIQNNAKTYIIPNYGFIIGTTQFKKLIMKNYFNNLINEGFCWLEYINNLNNKIFNLKNEYFEMIFCDTRKINEKYKSLFPYIKFQQNDFNFTFIFSYYSLFTEFKGNNYFLIIFPDEKCNNNNWYLGVPFLRKYQFIYNYDSKTIGFYNEYLKERKEIKNENSNFIKSHLRIIIEVSVAILLILLIFFDFIIGQKINKQRKKRANELSDDNYEYFSKEKGKSENDLNLGI